MTPQEGGAGPARPHSMLTTPPGLGCALVQQAASPAAGRRRSRAADPGAVTQQANRQPAPDPAPPSEHVLPPPFRLRPATTSAVMLSYSTSLIFGLCSRIVKLLPESLRLQINLHQGTEEIKNADTNQHYHMLNKLVYSLDCP